jgi:FAD/FMN-containing dehydrogenase
VGGAGYTWRQYGLTIDHLVEVEVVLADSSIVRASVEENPDLFFAVRGAGASFGIVTDFVFQTLPSPPEAISFSYLWNTTDAPSRAEIFKAWQAWSTGPSLSPEMQTILATTQDSIHMSGAYFGTLDEFNALGISDILPPAQQVSADSFTSFLEISQGWNGQLGQSGREPPSFFYTKSSFFRPQTAIPDSVVDQLFDYLATADTGAESWVIEAQAGGGQNGAVPASATAFPHRDAIFVLFSYAATNGSVTATTTDFLDTLHALTKSGHPDEYYGEYAGFVDTRADPERARYNNWGSNLERLGRIKATYDPNDVFHNEQSVLPSCD